ncbi:unnamed protein product (macronuclear) [Paramecium tetraurelia]|uniref:MORN repeat protein n=1 Tax=Paramecium tetraurelia TaxID=5888 RepID=A0E7R4_PARTE|nr:uncharacterized protein GSPATT00024059001 [Paramecium tetraurelia]CAK91331.1 unnamed protein product [Paramecium tetraurelia]|eukprot:XP_001458728.1 hypothetical protein (macronuclear) [Paramecium tetraurelia strain d4-2]
MKISKLFCQNNHFQLFDDDSFIQQQIIGVCTRTECKEKLVCVECQDTLHKDHIGMILSYEQLKEQISHRYSDIEITSLNAELLSQQFLCLHKDLLDSISKVEKQFTESSILYQQLEQTQNIIRLIQSDRYYEIKNEQFHTFFQVIQDKALDSQQLDYLVKLIQSKMEASIECLDQLNQSINNQPQQYNPQNIVNQHISLKKIKQFYLQNPLDYTKIPKELNIQNYGSIKEFKNENEIYHGEIDDKAQKHGKGIQIQKKGDIIYEGIWVDNQLRWGQKTQFNELQECSILMGCMRDKKLNGQGIKITSSGDLYKGQFTDDKLNQEGYQVTSNGEIYKGSFKDNKRHGQGELENRDGEFYIGAFKNGKKNGEGYMNLKNGDNYSGCFQDDKFHGKGEYTAKKDNSKFKGSFQNNKKEGNFEIIYNDKSLETGTFQNDIRHGQFRYYPPNQQTPSKVVQYNNGKVCK